jgi:hypothetical protein
MSDRFKLIAEVPKGSRLLTFNGRLFVVHPTMPVKELKDNNIKEVTACQNASN